MVQVKDLTELMVRNLWQEVKGEQDWCEGLKEQALRLMKRLLERAIDEEILARVRVRC